MPKKKSKTGGAYTPKKRGSGRFTVEGKSVAELLKNGSAHLHQYTESNLRAIVTRLSSAGNKRLRRAEQSGGPVSPAIEDVKKSGGKFSGKGKDHEGLKAEFLRLKKFFEDPTSTQEGWQRVQRRATREAQKKGVIVPTGGSAVGGKGKKPTQPPVRTVDREALEDWVEGGEYADPEVTSSWVFHSDTNTFSHPIYGEGWTYDSSIDAYVDPVTGEVVSNPNAPRMYHDYDATSDWRKTEGGTETGDLWKMVDSIAKMDPSFARQVGGYKGKDLRMRLFYALDEAYVNNPGWSMEDARNYVASRLEEIKAQNDEFLGEASKIGKSEFM